MLDLLIADGLLICPEGLTQTPGYVGVEGGRIACIGTGQPPAARRVIDAKGAMVCPGLIDPHGHLDGHPYAGLLSLHQGVTTTVGGNCGYSPGCLDTFFRRQEQQGYPIHQAELVGHATLRRIVGVEDPFQSAHQHIHRMTRLAEQALRDGACGVSFGFGYAPGSALEEAVPLCRCAAEYGRLFAVDTHMRTHMDMYSLVEVLCLARQSHARSLVSHFVYQYGEGVEREALALMDHARQNGLDIWADSGMYTHWATSIGSALFEPDIMRSLEMPFHMLRMATGEHRGQVLDEALFCHVRTEHPQDSVVVQVDNDDAVYTILSADYMMPSSDAGHYLPGEGHPQIAGTFPRFFSKMVRTLGVLTWPQAVARATLLPASVFCLHDRGRLQVDCVADLLVFDPDALIDRADYVGLGLPDALPEGVLEVIVGGVHALSRGQVLCDTAGCAIRYGRATRDQEVSV